MSHKGKQLYCYTVHVIHCTNKPNTRTLAHKHLTCLTALFSRVRLHKKLGHSTKRYSQTTVPKNYDTWWPFGPNCPKKKKTIRKRKCASLPLCISPQKTASTFTRKGSYSTCTSSKLHVTVARRKTSLLSGDLQPTHSTQKHFAPTDRTPKILYTYKRTLSELSCTIEPSTTCESSIAGKPKQPFTQIMQLRDEASLYKYLEISNYFPSVTIHTAYSYSSAHPCRYVYIDIHALHNPCIVQITAYQLQKMQEVDLPHCSSYS